MKINLIIGAGQLGSRHLQGLIKATESQKIFVIDPSLESLEIAKQRANEINHSIEINYLTSWSSLPIEFDLVIVATGASVRSQIAKNLLGNYVVKNLILEKILFQDIKSYEDIKQLIQETKTATWVNHPRRLTKHYGAIKKEIASTGEKVVFNVIGSNWGLACNALHFIDLCSFLTNSEVYQLDMDWLNSEIKESKRVNNVEFTGTIKGLMKNKSVFTISSLDGTIGDISVIISTNTNRWIVQEGKSESIIHMTTTEGFKPVINHFKTEFQSSLTTDIVKSIFNQKAVLIPTYDEACSSHLPFITTAINKYNHLTAQNTSICPIT
jgi:hypothetical protein